MSREAWLPKALDLFEIQPWAVRGGCTPANRPSGLTANDWYPERGKKVDPRVFETCRACSVGDECLEYGFDEKFGIWGGLTAAERRRIRRYRRQQVLDTQRTSE